MIQAVRYWGNFDVMLPLQRENRREPLLGNVRCGCLEKHSLLDIQNRIKAAQQQLDTARNKFNQLSLEDDDLLFEAVNAELRAAEMRLNALMYEAGKSNRLQN